MGTWRKVLTPLVWRVLLGVVLLLVVFILFVVLAVADILYTAHRVTAPVGGHPWREGLVARVYWDGEESQDMREGFADAARLFGVDYEYVDSAEEANIRVRLNSLFSYSCKWGGAFAFVSLDPVPGPFGSESGEIFVCGWRFPFGGPSPPYRSLIAHEAAHIFAAVGHFGTGLMAQGGGDGSEWFSEVERECMLRRVAEFRESLPRELLVGWHSEGDLRGCFDELSSPPAR